MFKQVVGSNITKAIPQKMSLITIFFKLGFNLITHKIQLSMKTTVCQLPDHPGHFEKAWNRLAGHVQNKESELVLLPEMPFFPWVAQSKKGDPEVWKRAVEAHDRWLERLTDLAPAVVLGSRPVIHKGVHLNEGFIAEPDGTYTAAHHKYYLPQEKWFWEASWYERGEEDFSVHRAGKADTGFLICTELWVMSRAVDYGKQGVHLIATPRATERATAEKWLTGGRVCSISAGAYHISSNRCGPDQTETFEFGGKGWIAGPDGQILGITTDESPFFTADLNPAAAEKAKETYPRYIF